MAVHTLLLPDGSQISSGAEASVSIQRVELTQKVNTKQALTCGSVFSACLQVSLLSADGTLPLSAGQQLTLLRDGKKQGVFWVETAEKTGKGLFALTAYDSLSRLDQDLSAWLAGLSHWPYSLLELAQMVCRQCGLTLKTEQIPSGAFPVGAFKAREVTGRRILGWIAEAAGCFCRADGDGQVEFLWYTPRDLCLQDRGDTYYFRGSYHYEDPVDPIDQVQIRQDTKDVGTMYPADFSGENVYVVEGNPLLQAENSTYLEEIAQNLYERLSGISYFPGKVAVAGALEIEPGQIITVRDSQGTVRSFYVMERSRSAGKDTLLCTGVQNREKAAVSNRQDVSALSGKVLRLQVDVDGVLAQNETAAGDLAQLQLAVDGLRTQIKQTRQEGESLKTQMTELEQTGDKWELRLSKIEEGGTHKVTTSTGYRFDGEGLWIGKSGEEMENRLDHTGMYVHRSGQVVLQANNQGVEATDVTVRNYLHLGEHARLEDYSNGTDSRRTACFWIGGSDAGI